MKTEVPTAFPWSHGDLTCTGMTLRDYFAAKAMQTILKDQYEDGLYVGDGIENTDLYAELCAVSSYIMADAMIKARNVKT